MLFKLICAGTASYVTGPNMGKAFGPGLPHNDSTPSPLKKLPCAKTTSCALEFNQALGPLKKTGYLQLQHMHVYVKDHLVHLRINRLFK